MGVVRGSSLVSMTKTASSFAGSVLLAWRQIEWTHAHSKAAFFWRWSRVGKLEEAATGDLEEVHPHR
jgi:hypothetical protein